MLWETEQLGIRPFQAQNMKVACSISKSVGIFDL